MWDWVCSILFHFHTVNSEALSVFYYFVTHTCFWLSYMRVYLLSPLPPLSLSLLWCWGAQEEEEEEEAGLGVTVPGGELTKVGHGYSPAPLFPLETQRMRTFAPNPIGPRSFFFYICALFFLYLCTFLFLSLPLLRSFCCGLSLSVLGYVSCFFLRLSLWGWSSAGY